MGKREESGMWLSFRRAGVVGTGGGERWRKKLGGFGCCGRFMFRVYTKRVHECKVMRAT